MNTLPKTNETLSPIPTADQEAPIDMLEATPIEARAAREFPLVTEASEAIVIFERNGIEVRASLKPAGKEGEPYFIEAKLQGEGEPLDDRFYMVVQRLTVISLKGTTASIKEGAVIAPAYIHPTKAAGGLKVAINGRA